MEVLEYISQAKSMLGNYLPPAIRYLNIGSFVVDNTVKTMLLDNTQVGKLFIRVNSDWVVKLKIQELTRILCDIATKICLHHCTTRKTFNNYGLIASDIICNRFVCAAGIITNIDFSDVFDRTNLNEYKKKAMLKYREINGEYWDEDKFVMEKLAYYISLCDEKQNNEGNGNGNSKNEGDIGDNENSSSNGNSNDNDSETDNENSDSSENGDENEGNTNKSNFQTDRHSGKGDAKGQSSKCNAQGCGNSEAVEEYFNDMSRADKWNENLYTKDMTEIETNNMEKNGSLASTRWGLMNGNLFKRILKANKPPVDPMLILKQFIGDKETSNRVETRTKPNRRYGVMYPGSKKVRKKHFCIFGDASGSMGDVQLSQVLDLIIGMGKSNCKIDYAWWDVNCDEPTKLKSSKVNKSGVDVSKGGGTNPMCIFDMIHDKKLKSKYTGIIIISDMFFEMNKPTNFDMNKVFWIGTTGSSNPPKFVKKNRFLGVDNVKQAINKKFKR